MKAIIRKKKEKEQKENLPLTIRREIIFVLIIAGIFSLLTYLSNLYFLPSVTIIISLALLALGLNLTVYVLQEKGTATLFYLLQGLLTFNLLDIGIIGWKKVLIFFIAGIIFEIINGLLSLLFSHFSRQILENYLKIIISTIISLISIPLVGAFLLSSNISENISLPLFNLLLLCALTSLGASLIVALFWHLIRKTKTILKLRSYLGSLER